MTPRRLTSSSFRRRRSRHGEITAWGVVALSIGMGSGCATTSPAPAVLQPTHDAKPGLKGPNGWHGLAYSPGRGAPRFWGAHHGLASQDRATLPDIFNENWYNAPVSHSTVAPKPLPIPSPFLTADRAYEIKTSPFRRDVAASSSPAAASRVVGRSIEGRDILLHRFGRGSGPVLVFGGIHGSEPESVVLAERLLEHLQTQSSRHSEVNVAVIPIANPDGYLRKRRTNARGVDVNRNFPSTNWRKSSNPRSMYYGGPAPGGEPETQALMKVVEELKPGVIISIHSITGKRRCNNHDGPDRAWAERMSRHNEYPVKESMGYPTPGSFGGWAGVDRRIPVVTLELPRGAPADVLWRENGPALMEVIQAASTSASERRETHPWND